MKKLSTLLIAVVALVTMLTYGFDFQFNENSSGLKTFLSPGASPNAMVTESFDGLVLPSGWTNTAISGATVWTFLSSGTNPTCSPHSGAGMTQFYSFTGSGNRATLITPSFSLTSGTGQVSFWMYRDPVTQPTMIV